jgi:signal recognition particle GTPase
LTCADTFRAGNVSHMDYISQSLFHLNHGANYTISTNLIVVVLNDADNILNVVEIFFYTIGAFDQLKQNATKARIPFYGRYSIDN